MRVEQRWPTCSASLGGQPEKGGALLVKQSRWFSWRLGREEPDEARVSRPGLGEAGGEISPAYSIDDEGDGDEVGEVILEERAAERSGGGSGERAAPGD